MVFPCHRRQPMFLLLPLLPRVRSRMYKLNGDCKHPDNHGIMRKEPCMKGNLGERKRWEAMEEPTEQSAQLPYGEVETLQPYFQQLQDQYQLFMDHHQKLQDRYRGLVEHHTLLEKLYDVLMNHQYSLQDQNQVLEDYHQALEEQARMWQDYLQTLREHLH